MQNKANFPDDKMNVSSILTKDYENNSNCKLCENKANSKPNKANLPDAQMNVSTISTKDYENISNWTLDENKANTNPIQTQTNPISKPKQPTAFSHCLLLKTAYNLNPWYLSFLQRGLRVSK